MCVCDPRIRTPFCGRPGCEWPKPEPPRFSVHRVWRGSQIVGQAVAVANGPCTMSWTGEEGVAVVAPSLEYLEAWLTTLWSEPATLEEIP